MYVARYILPVDSTSQERYLIPNVERSIEKMGLATETSA